MAASKSTALTAFSWGYFGWGNATEQFVKAADAVERSRGFRPPIFVDTRIRRAVRAVGFNGSAFERLLGPRRHRWMKELGNRRIMTGRGPRIQIAEPAATDDLLNLIVEAAEERRRVIVFCGCQWPRINGQIHCHRAAIAELLLAEARQRSLPLTMVEWPGGEPERLTMEVDEFTLRAVDAGRSHVGVAPGTPLAALAALPWCSALTLTEKADRVYRIVGPAIWRKEDWYYRVLAPSDSLPNVTHSRRQADGLRTAYGLEPLAAG